MFKHNYDVRILYRKFLSVTYTCSRTTHDRVHDKSTCVNIQFSDIPRHVKKPTVNELQFQNFHTITLHTYCKFLVPKKLKYLYYYILSKFLIDVQ